MMGTVLITGASSGIGLAFAKLFAAKGHSLVLVSQNADNLKKTEEEIQKENRSIRILSIPADLSEPSGPQKVYRQLKEMSIPVDILVNNAGVQVYGYFHEASLEDTEKMMNLNMHAVVKLTRLFAEDMVRRGSGRILNVGSTGSFQQVPLNSVYCASKAFVLHFSEGIGEELKGTGVTVTTLCPGATDSNFARRGNVEGTKLFNGKLLEPRWVAEMGYKALVKGKPLAITGLSNRLTAFSIRLMPRKLVLRIGMNMMREKGA